MSGVASLAALTLAAILGWAAMSKLLRPRETIADFRQLGLPAPPLMARVVPAMELLAAMALLVSPGWGGVFSFALLAGFTAFLVTIIRSGRVVSCGCFGSAGKEPVSVVEVARNVALLVLAATATTISSLSRPDLPDTMLFTTAGLIAVILVQLVALARVSNGLFRTELAGELTTPSNPAAEGASN